MSMMHDLVFKSVVFLRISSLKYLGSKLDKLLINISDKYYSQISNGVIHEDAIALIMNVYYTEKSKELEDCRYFVVNRKQSIDTIFDTKYGKSGRFMSHLFKLIQKIYLDKYLNDERESYEVELNKSMILLNKNFNKVVLYTYSKYDD